MGDKINPKTFLKKPKMKKDNYYQKHIFICTNQKEKGKCCGQNPMSQETIDLLKKQVKELSLNKEGGVRISASGCLGRCSEGPVAVSYPEGRWFYLSSDEDLKKIMNSIEGCYVEDEKIF